METIKLINKKRTLLKYWYWLNRKSRINISPPLPEKNTQKENLNGKKNMIKHIFANLLNYTDDDFLIKVSSYY